MLFVSRDELAQLVGCEQTSKACMRRWLEHNEWPFEVDRNGFPKVRRDYYDARTLGRELPSKPLPTEPNYAVFA